MNFEETYKKYKDGTATDEEKKFVEAEIAKAKEISKLLEEKEPTVVAVGEPDGERIKKALKAFNYKTAVRATLTVVIALCVAAAVVLGVVFGISMYSAKNSLNYSQEQAVELAKQSVVEYTGEEIGDNCVVKYIERELDMDNGLRQSVYVYDIELICDNVEYEIKVSAESGYAIIADIDGLDRNTQSKKTTKSES